MDDQPTNTTSRSQDIPKTPANAAKAATLARVEAWKNRVVIASAMVFSATAMLVASHQVGASSGSTASAISAVASSSGSSDSQQGFFNQGDSNGQQSYGFGSSSGQSAVAGTGSS